MRRDGIYDEQQHQHAHDNSGMWKGRLSFCLTVGNQKYLFTRSAILKSIVIPQQASIRLGHCR